MTYPLTRVVAVLSSTLLVLALGQLPVATADPPAVVDTVALVNPLIGTTGAHATEYGGMVPQVTPPFAMTKWTPQTRENSVSRAAYHYNDTKIGGFLGSHQPAIWMGEWGQVSLMPGVGSVKPRFADRALPFSHADEVSTAALYSVTLNGGADGSIAVRMTGTSRAGYLEFGFANATSPNVLVQATRSGNVGHLEIDPVAQEITGYNPERQDKNLGPFSAAGFKGYFVVKFDTPFASYGTALDNTLTENYTSADGAILSGFARFATSTTTVRARVGVSLISVEQARANLAAEI
ncbi:MAG: hypothetical protein LBG70_04445, partial [Bifidobacteriaceae bacterium]|nr:hypothetical protein [Bifidobacteriaceae bacterium]